MKVHRPNGPKPIGWEKNILKVRAFEMVLVLFYVEDLRRSIISAVEGTDKLFGAQWLHNDVGKMTEGKKIERVRAVLVSEGVITQAESDELFELLRYRNVIAHQIDQLTADVGANADLASRHFVALQPLPIYDYTAAKRAKELSRKVSRCMMGKFVMTVTMDSLRFEAAERVYLSEIERLKKRVNKQVAAANSLIADTHRIIRELPDSLKEIAQPGHPGNVRANGSLTKTGARCAFLLFEARAAPLAVAYMMRISLRSANLWFKKWERSQVLIRL